MREHYEVAIVGAGFSGASLAISLMERLPEGVRILLVGTPGSIGRGVAYGTHAPEHLLNVPAARMSIRPDDQDHFLRWLAEQSGADTQPAAERFVARTLYGKYVRETLDRAIADSSSRLRADTIEATVVELRRSGRGYALRTACGREFLVSAAVLCAGHGRPAFPPPFDTISGPIRDRLIADPWTDSRMGSIGPDDRVLFIGSGLTMVDQTLSLVAGGHRARLDAVSRHGLLPLAHRKRQTPPIAAKLPDRLASPSLLLRSVRSAAKRAAEAGGDWRAVVDGLRPESQHLWQSLDRAGRRRFLRHVTAFWSVHRHRMAPEIGERIASLQRDGLLQVRSARVVAVRRAARGVTVALRPRGAKTVELVAYDWIVNCSGAGDRWSEPMWRQALAEGLVRRHRSGIDVDAQCRVVGGDGRAATGLYALGPLTAGRFLEITAVPEIRVQAAEVATAVVAFLVTNRSEIAPLAIHRLSGRRRPHAADSSTTWTM